ncbi:MAG: AAA family ATPase [Alphaproteobacteria bacterium]|nr:AAA family ATPase [Alphaproteobacteria bacterium]MDX5414719.1 AAA family ATPase [Alphaproteobacteria bacterium]MDX5491900.1 AAA family ATPase [Alphaproteobacteria bacterium]
MLSSILKIEGLGVFKKYSRSKDLADFERFNVFYGENGSGKTTLSRMFTALEAGAHTDYPDLQYSVQCSAGLVTQGTAYPCGVRVFNADFVEANIGGCEGPIPHILIVGEENKALAEELAAEQATVADRTNAISIAEQAIAKLESSRGKAFSAIAKTIGEATSGTTLRSYRKPDAEAAYEKLEAFKTLDESELDLHRATVRQEQMEPVEDFVLPSEPTADGEKRTFAEIISSAFADVGAFTVKTAQAAVIRRLAENPDIGHWVEGGLEVHRKHGGDQCEFCGQSISKARLAELAAHFSDEDQELKMSIEEGIGYLEIVREYTKGIQPPSKLALYSELRDEAALAIEEFEIGRAKLYRKLDEAVDALNQKIGLRSASYETLITPDIDALLESAAKIGSLTRRHNEKCASFKAKKEAARSALEIHYLSSIADQIKDIDRQIQTQKKVISDNQLGNLESFSKRTLDELKRSILEKKSRVANAHTASADLTQKLKTFLGRDEITFESTDEGYLVYRRGKPAKRLSEGEKTAIAFVYFIVRLSDQSFNLSDGVVVIDDPISSLDSTSIYQAFSYMKNAVKDAKQIFILTHNFDFLKLVLNWFHGIPKRVGGKGYFMIVCSEDADGRCSRICKLDQLLQDHPSEYQYLFKKLYQYESDGTIESAYHIPNIARKVLETFLEFHVPAKSKLYDKLEEINFDPDKKTAIYKFTNDLSHMTGKGFDPALVAESQKNTKYLLEMIESAAPSHYAGLVLISS